MSRGERVAGGGGDGQSMKDVALGPWRFGPSQGVGHPKEAQLEGYFDGLFGSEQLETRRIWRRIGMDDAAGAAAWPSTWPSATGQQTGA